MVFIIFLIYYCCVLSPLEKYKLVITKLWEFVWYLSRIYSFEGLWNHNYLSLVGKGAYEYDMGFDDRN